MIKRPPQPTNPTARAALDRARNELLLALRYITEPVQHREIVGAVRATERTLGVRKAEVRRKERV